MIIEHDDDGRIQHVIFDPVAKDVAEFYSQRPNTLIIPIKPADPTFSMRVNDDTHYVKNGKLLARRRLNIPSELRVKADGNDSVEVKIPRGAKVWVDGEPIDVTGTVLTITSDAPAEYEIVIEHWPSRRMVCRVTAT